MYSSRPPASGAVASYIMNILDGKIIFFSLLFFYLFASLTQTWQSYKQSKSKTKTKTRQKTTTTTKKKTRQNKNKNKNKQTTTATEDVLQKMPQEDEG